MKAAHLSAVILSGVLACQPVMASSNMLALVPPASVGLDGGRLNRFGPLIEQKIHAHLLAGAVMLVARHGHVAYLKCFGDADLKTGRKMTPETIFRIYSMSKPIIAVGAMMLYEQGKFDLRDPVSEYIPAFAHMQVSVTRMDPQTGHLVTTLEPAKRPITILDLLRHTSGLGYFFTKDAQGKPYYARYGVSALEDKLSLAQWVDRLAKAPLVEQPGAEFYYSYGIDVVGRLIEIWSGQPLDVYLHDHIFAKLGMKDTGFDVPPDKLDRLATLYTPSTPGVTDAEGITGLGGPIVPYPSGPGPQDSFKHKAVFFSGGGGLVSTALDYARFTIMLANGGELGGVRLLSPKTVDLIHSDVLGDIPRGPGGPWDGDGFGLTVEISHGPGPTGTLSTAGEYDWAGVAQTQFFVDPKEQLIGVMMSQVIPGAPYWGRMVRQLATQAIVGP